MCRNILNKNLLLFLVIEFLMFKKIYNITFMLYKKFPRAKDRAGVGDENKSSVTESEKLCIQIQYQV